MAKRELIIDIQKGDFPVSKVYILSQSIKGLTTYERAKAINRFIEKETKVLETCIENDIREFLHKQGINIQDGSQEALNQAFSDLKAKGKEILISDRYFELNGERIIGESPNSMTVILEDDILSAAIEVIIDERNDTTTQLV